MAERKIIAYFMHEAEEAAAHEALEDATGTEGFVIGTIDEAEVPALQDRGLIVQYVDETPPPEPLDELVARTRNMATPEAAIERDDVDIDATTEWYLLQMIGPLIQPWRDALTTEGVEVVEATGPNRFMVRMQPDKFSAVRNLDFVLRLVPYSAARAAPRLKPAARSRGPAGPGELQTFDILLHRPEDMDAVLAWLSDQSVTVSGHTERKVRIHVPGGAPALNELGRLPEVSLIEEYQPPRFFNDRARILMGLDDPTGAAIIGLDGSGEIVGVADSGIDEQHPDFAGRIRGVVALGRPMDASDTHGHGTHVAGSILGGGAASNGSIRGTAPAAELFFQSIMDFSGGLGGLPLDLKDLFQEAYDTGARIHNNSWGTDVAGAYNFNSIEADEFAHDNPDMLIVVAAGNAGSARDPQNTSRGSVDWLSIGSPATSKNSLTVGASRSDRDSGGFAALTFNDVWPNSFPDDPIASEKTSGDKEGLAAFSSRGPCDDRRIKPDLVAPGTNIASAKSSRAPLGNFWGSFPGHSGHYAYMGGTSMAAPLVSGCAALVRQFYRDQRQHQPSAALVKATLINGSRWLSGADATADFADMPNFHQGFGCVNMPTTLPNGAEPAMTLEFIDSWDQTVEPFTRVGQRTRWTFDVDDDLPLRICLVWTDLPARSLQNNLNLFVEKMPGGQKHLGNADLPQSLRLPDAENNVEVVRLETPEAGSYLIQITAGNLLSGGQDFALVVTGANVTNFRRF